MLYTRTHGREPSSISPCIDNEDINDDDDYDEDEDEAWMMMMMMMIQ
jgi:hypothetical protein